MTFALTAGKQAQFDITAVTEEGASAVVVWDQIQVSEIAPSRVRADVGSRQAVRLQAVLEYDQTPLGAGDALWVNGEAAPWDPATGGFRFEHTEASPREVSFSVTAAHQQAHDISLVSASVDTISIIWDELLVTLASDRERVNMGAEALLRITAVHAFDGSPLQGDVLLNGPTVRETLGAWAFQAKEVQDERFGLTRFSTNQVTVTWDRVAVALEPTFARVQAGGPVSIQTAARYESDDTLFSGAIVLDNPLVHHDLGPQDFTVASIADEEHGLTLFAANTVTVTFDRLLATHTTTATMPGSVQVRGSSATLRTGRRWWGRGSPWGTPSSRPTARASTT